MQVTVDQDYAENNKADDDFHFLIIPQKMGLDQIYLVLSLIGMVD